MNQLIWEGSNFEDTAVICKHYVFNLEISKKFWIENSEKWLEREREWESEKQRAIERERVIHEFHTLHTLINELINETFQQIFTSSKSTIEH